jgi:excinuclease ABC subunit C
MSDDTSVLERQIHAAPAATGCYVFKDKRGKVLYVGKAIDLSRRVKAYLRPGADGRWQIPSLMNLARSVEFIIMEHEKEALVLENNLIKRFRPRFNIVLASDDKTFVSVRMDMRHEFPRATIVHKYKRDGATYYGPYSSASKLYKTLEVFKRYFPLRLCSDHVLRNRTRPCVYHEIGACVAPCMPGKVSRAEYAAIVRDFVRALEGKDDSVARDLETRMNQAANDLNFERAAEWRDKLLAVQESTLRQRAQIGTGRVGHRDIHGLYREADRVSIATLLYRDGRLEDTATREFESLLPDEEVLHGFLTQYYERASFVPEEVVVSLPLEGMDALGAWISDRAGRKVHVLHPQRGDKARLAQLAATNARHALKVRAETEQRSKQLLRALQEAAGLERTPVRMECFDISHGGGKDSVGAGVCFMDGEPAKQHYRRYKIKTHDRNDDFASMEEVLRRRLKRGLTEGNLPDLIVIDGGKGQLSRVQQVFDELNIVGIDLIALAKSRRKGQAGWETGWTEEAAELKPERVFLPGQDDPLILDARSQALLLLMRIRDEAHRFAVTFHRKQKRKSNLRSSLDDVPGVGPKKKRALIKHFGSPKAVREANAEELTKVEGISPKLAQAITEHFSKLKE